MLKTKLWAFALVLGSPFAYAADCSFDLKGTDAMTYTTQQANLLPKSLSLLLARILRLTWNTQAKCPKRVWDTMWLLPNRPM